MTQNLVIIGAGGFGRETLDVVEAVNQTSGAELFKIVGVVDDSPTALSIERLNARGFDWIGTVDQWLERQASEQYLIAVGDPAARAQIHDRIALRVKAAPAIVHPRAMVGSRSAIGAGSVICSGAQISTNVTLGLHVHINPNATIGHDAVLEDFVSINPGAIVSGEVLIKSKTLVGAGAVILQGLSVGSGTVIGASACVVRSVEDRRTVKGVPAG